MRVVHESTSFFTDSSRLRCVCSSCAHLVVGTCVEKKCTCCVVLDAEGVILSGAMKA